MSKKFEQKAIEAYNYNARDNMKNWQLCQEMGRLKQLIVDTLAGEDTED